MKIEEGSAQGFEAWSINKLLEGLSDKDKRRFIPSMLESEYLKIYRKIGNMFFINELMVNREIDVVILDVDGTLSEDISWLKLTQGLGASSEEHADIFEQFKKGTLSYPEAKRKLITLWQATGNNNRKFMEEMFRSWDLKEDAEETAAYLKEAYRLCLISGAVDLYVGVVAEKLGIADWYANTELVWDEKGNLIDFNYFADQAGKKLEQFREYIAKNNLQKDRCAVIGDGDSDIALFRELKYGIAVNKNPHEELESLAYKTVKELRELKGIL